MLNRWTYIHISPLGSAQITWEKDERAKVRMEETSSHAGLGWYSWLLAAAQSKARFSVFPPKSIRGGPLGCPGQPSGLKSRGSGCPLGSPRPPYTREPGTKLIVLPSPSLPRSSSCRLSPVLHLPSNLAVCDSNVRPPGEGICWPATGAATIGRTGPSMHCPAPDTRFPIRGGVKIWE